jgi:hypothetical protein
LKPARNIGVAWVAGGSTPHEERSEPLLVVVMPAWTVHVTVVDLLLRSGTNVRELDVEVEGLTRKWVICIEGDVGVGELHHARWNLISLRGHELNHEANRDILREVTLRTRKGNYHLLISLAVPLRWSDLYLKRGARRLAYKSVLKARNDLRVAVEIHEWVRSLGGIEDLTTLIGEGVVKSYNGIFCDEG